jgi:hypothetical protein
MLTVRLLAAPLQLPEDGVTVTSPGVEPQLTVTEVMPWPLAMLAPVGTVQV